MPETCSCGAELPADALFCHKCGKPQRAIVTPDPVPTEAPPPSPPIVDVQPLAVNFHNRVALRIAILVAVGATFLFFLPYVNWLAAGYFAVFFYKRRTGQVLDVVLGVRMGWITGVIMFLIALVIVSFFALILAATGGIDQVQQQLRSVVDPRAQQTLREMLGLLQNRAELVLSLVYLFVFTTFLSMAGGALGAKLTGRS